MRWTLSGAAACCSLKEISPLSSETRARVLAWRLSDEPDSSQLKNDRPPQMDGRLWEICRADRVVDDEIQKGEFLAVVLFSGNTMMTKHTRFSVH